MEAVRAKEEAQESERAAEAIERDLRIAEEHELKYEDVLYARLLMSLLAVAKQSTTSFLATLPDEIVQALLDALETVGDGAEGQPTPCDCSTVGGPCGPCDVPGCPPDDCECRCTRVNDEGGKGRGPRRPKPGTPVGDPPTRPVPGEPVGGGGTAKPDATKLDSGAHPGPFRSNSGGFERRGDVIYSAVAFQQAGAPAGGNAPPKQGRKEETKMGKRRVLVVVLDVRANAEGTADSPTPPAVSLDSRLQFARDRARAGYRSGNRKTRFVGDWDTGSAGALGFAAAARRDQLSRLGFVVDVGVVGSSGELATLLEWHKKHDSQFLHVEIYSHGVSEGPMLLYRDVGPRAGSDAIHSRATELGRSLAAIMTDDPDHMGHIVMGWCDACDVLERRGDTLSVGAVLAAASGHIVYGVSNEVALPWDWVDTDGPKSLALPESRRSWGAVVAMNPTLTDAEHAEHLSQQFEQRVYLTDRRRDFSGWLSFSPVVDIVRRVTTVMPGTEDEITLVAGIERGVQSPALLDARARARFQLAPRPLSVTEALQRGLPVPDWSVASLLGIAIDDIEDLGPVLESAAGTLELQRENLLAAASLGGVGARPALHVVATWAMQLMRDPLAGGDATTEQSFGEVFGSHSERPVDFPSKVYVDE